LRRKREEKEAKERKLQIIREEVFKTTITIYIEPFASRLLLVF
jgi:hypothetical protein